MNYKRKQNILRIVGWPAVWVFLLILVTFVFAGCKSAAVGAEEQDASEESGAETTITSPAVQTADSTHSVGTIGFTEEGHPYKGDLNASVTIEEFSSFQCPFCGRFFEQTYPELTRRYVDSGKVLYIFRDFPLSGQPQSPKAAEAARCAGDLGGAQAFWDMHDLLFGRQREWSGRADAVQTFKVYGSELGLDQAAFDECLDSARKASIVESDAREGATRGVRGTPTFFINGQPLVGAQPMAAFATAIDGALAGKPVSPPAAEGSASSGASPDSPSAENLVPTPAVFSFKDGDASVFSLGDPRSPVTIVEFTDLQCPFCQQYFQQTWSSMKERFIDTGRVYYVVKDFPLTSIHPEAFKAHEAARCAAEVSGDLVGRDLYWQMHDLLFERQAEWSGNAEHIDVYKRYAGELNIDQAAFDDCIDAGRQAGAVQAELDEGIALGVNGTPTFFVAGYPFSGARTIEFFDQAVTLAESGQLRAAITEAIVRALEQQQQQQQPRPTMAPADIPINDAPAKGAPDAPITIVEYSDYQCPFCERHFSETMPQLTKDYVDNGTVRYVFKDFPLTSIHPQAPAAAVAARCAREIGGDSAYWKMHDKLFEGQAQWAGNSEHAAVFSAYANQLDLDRAAFDECMKSGRYASAVQADLEEGAGFGVTGTPAFFVNGQPLRGAQPYDVFAQLIQALLAERE